MLWLLDLLPPSSDPWMLRIIICCSFLGTFCRIQAGVTGSSIMADIADEHDLQTGRRREGIFFGAISFSGKAAHGLGIVVAGFAIEDFSALRYIRDLLGKPGMTDLCEDLDLIADPDDPRDLFGMVRRNASMSIAA